jgi:hypothetical protein
MLQNGKRGITTNGYLCKRPENKRIHGVALRVLINLLDLLTGEPICRPFRGDES